MTSELRPDHAGRPVRFEYRGRERTEAEELLAVHTPAEIRAAIERIDAAGDGLTVGQRILRDAHGWDDENDRPNQRD